MDQEACRRAGAGVPMQHRICHRQHRLLPRQRLADDTGEETGRCLVRLARPHHDAREPDADTIDKAAARVVGEEKLDRPLSARHRTSAASDENRRRSLLETARQTPAIEDVKTRRGR